MEKLPPGTRRRARQFASILNKMARRYRKSYPKRKGPNLMKDEVIKTTKAFSECARVGSSPNMEIIEIHDTVDMTETPFPLLDLPLITEEYIDYGDDQNTSKILSKYEVVSNRTMSVCYLNSKSLAMVAKDRTESVGDESFTFSATNKLGKYISDTNIISHNVKVLVSKDFVRYDDEEVSVLLCTSTRNPFWWMRKQNISTSVAMLTFIVRNEEVHEFEEPFTISFENTQKNFSWIPFHETVIPRQPNYTAFYDRDFEKMQIFRIDVFGQQGYVVEFMDLAANDSFYVYISDFVKPSPDEFKGKATQIHEKNSLVFIPHEHHFNSWHYLCISPNEGVGDQRLAVKFRIYALSCSSWESESRSWVFSCSATGTPSLSRFDCLCYHSSVLAGRITTNYVKEEKTTSFLEHALELQTNWIIFISVAVAFFLYCLLLIMITLSSDWDRKRRIYCLSDMTESPQYEYLLITKTGNGFSDGTTSHIVFKLYGEEAATKEHVLNLPDPDRNILQRNQEDWFFVATENYLGVIEKLEIWFDCVGPKPSWYCSVIEVFDLQKNKYWRFNIKHRFEISTKVKHFLSAVPEQLENGKKKGKLSSKNVSMEGSHWWNIFRFPYHARNNEYDGEGISDYSRSDVLCWCSLLVLVLFSMTVLPVLGFWVPHITVLLWMTSAMASLFIYIVLLENVVRLVYNFTVGKTRRIERISLRIKPVLAYIGAQRDFVKEKYGIDSLRSYYGDLYKPLDRYKIKRRKYRAKIRRELLEIVQDMMMILIYVVLLYIAILKDNDPMAQISNQEVRDLLSGMHARRLTPGRESYNRKELENYINNTLIFSLQSLQWYGKYISSDPGMTIDNTNKYVGIPRLRQQRSDNYSCVVQPSMEFVTDHCISPFADGPELRDFSEGWGYEADSDNFARLNLVWKYHTEEIFGVSNYIGDFAVYPGGGYVATLGRTWKNSLININYLHHNNWIDRYTRGLFVEFLMYSPNSNLFQSVRVVFELSTTGLIHQKFRVRTTRLLLVQNKTSVMLQVVLALLIVMVLVMLLNLMFKLVKKKKLVFKDVWNLADMIIISLSVTCSFFYVERSFLVKILLDRVGKAKHNEFIKYFHLFSAEALLYILSAALVFIATLRLWKLLRSLLIIKITEETLRLCILRLFFVFFRQMLLVFMYHLVGMMLYGDQNEFRNNHHSMMTLTLLALFFLKTYDFKSVKTSTQQLYFFFHLIISYFFFTFYVAVISTCYTEARSYYSNRQKNSVLSYLYEQYQYYKEIVSIRMKGFRQRGGQDKTTFKEKKLVFAKANEYRYAKCLKITRNKIDTMSYITRGILRNMKYRSDFTKEDENSMKLITTHMIRPDTRDEEFFFVENSGNRKAILVDDLVFKKMERVITFLLTEWDEKEDIDKMILENIQNNLSDISRLFNTVLFRLNFYNPTK
ncbi:hypothetical protein JTB14_014083 [Gonioctena quinquepunctata]|nr:hypothetical protein JTB14_014083 [Gonioctena quinquepunctata]